MERFTLNGQRTLTAAITALFAVIIGLGSIPASGGPDGLGCPRHGPTDAAAWVADDPATSIEAFLPSDPAEPDDTRAEDVAPAAGLRWIADAHLVGVARASARCGPASHDVGALRARGPPAPRA